MASAQDQEAEDMQKAFQMFMISGRNSKAEPRKQTATSPLIKKNKVSASKVPALQKLARQVQLSIDAFQKAFVNDWMSVDDQMQLVVESIANLRTRLWIASRRLQQQDQMLSGSSSLKRATDSPWTQQGYRGRNSDLLIEDVELSLTHSLLAHERMLSALRQGVSQLNQTQDALGRKLDDVLSFSGTFYDYVVTLTSLDEQEQRIHASVGKQVEVCLELYRCSASDLQRKQLLGEALFESTNDELLCNPKDGIDENKSSRDSAQDMAHQVAPKWNRTHRECPLSLLKLELGKIEQSVNERVTR